MQLLNAKIDEMDQIEGVVNMNPLKRNYMPQMENKKRYYEVQKVVQPNEKKGQKPFKMFKEDAFIRETLAEAQYSKVIMLGQGRGKVKMFQDKRPQSSSAANRFGSMAIKPVSKKVQRNFARYERQLKDLQNIQGGGALLNGRTFDHRKVIEEIVKGYPMVKQQ